MDSVVLSWISELGTWSWAVLGGLLLILEVVIPGVFLMWFGLAALALALQALVIPMPWQAQIVLYVLYVAFFLWLSGKLQARGRAKADQSDELNARTEAMIGQTYLLQKAIVGGHGAVMIDDTIWRVKGDDAPEGSKVRVTKADGNLLWVEPVQETDSPSDTADTASD